MGSLEVTGVERKRKSVDYWLLSFVYSLLYTVEHRESAIATKACIIRVLKP